MSNNIISMLNGALVRPPSTLERQTTIFSPQSGDGNILPYIATIKSIATHSNNPDVPIQLCKGHSNQFICASCHKFFCAK